LRTPIGGAQFRRDVKLAQKRGKDMAKLREVILPLIKGVAASPAQRSPARRRMEPPPRLPHRAGLAADLQG